MRDQRIELKEIETEHLGSDKEYKIPTSEKSSPSSEKPSASSSKS